MNITWILIFIVQAITQVLLYYFAFKYRGKDERRYISLISWRRFECYSCHHIGWVNIIRSLCLDDIMFIDEEDDAIVVELMDSSSFSS
jgi:cytochrome c oxidase subunit 2